MIRWEETENINKDGHYPASTLLRYLDGELPTKESALVQEHLQACWSCRRDAERIQETVFTFVEYRDQLLRPLTPAPPSDEQRFIDRLQNTGTQLGRRSWLTQFNRLWRGFFSVSRIAIWPRPIAVATFAGLLVVTSWMFWLNRLPVVSASELLQKASEAQVLELRAKSQPMVYQKLRLQSTGQRTVTATWELWRDTSNARWRQAVQRASAQNFDESALVTEVSDTLRANQMNPQQPLSAVGFQTWRQTLQAPHEEVFPSAAEPEKTFTLRVMPRENFRTGQITEATLVVRQKDWHPLALSLRVRGANESKSYELSETAYEVLPLAALTAFTTADSNPTSPPPALPLTSPKTLLARVTTGEPISSPLPAPSLVELRKAEIAALYALHQAQADLGEQIEVTNEDGKQIAVRGLVATAKRKDELMQSLHQLAWVSVQLQTLEEAAQQMQHIEATPGGNESVTTLNETTAIKATATGVNPFQQRLIEQFGSHNAMTEAERKVVNQRVTQFYNSVETDASAALAEAWALRRLQERFAASATEVDVASRLRLEEMLNNHLARLRQRTRHLQASLHPHLAALAHEPLSLETVMATSRPVKIQIIFLAVEQISRLTDQIITGLPASSLSPTARALLVEFARLDAVLSHWEKN